MNDTPTITIELVRGTADMAATKALFLAYARSLDFSLCFEGFDEEMAAFPGAYAEPAGCLLLARVDGEAAGAVGLRPFDRNACEMKRLFVEPGFRRLGLGRHLVERLVAEAGRYGYDCMRLHTLIDHMKPAHALYLALGFRDIPPYTDNPLDAVIFMELEL